MMIHAYSQTYLAKISRAVGNMLHYAVLEFNIDGSDFLDSFIQSGILKTETQNTLPEKAVLNCLLRLWKKQPMKLLMQS